MERFKKIYQQGTIDVIEIWLDTETGVQYVFHRNGNAAGFTPLLDKDGKPVVTPQRGDIEKGGKCERLLFGEVKHDGERSNEK